jgi:hypothetical protein
MVYVERNSLKKSHIVDLMKKWNPYLYSDLYPINRIIAFEINIAKDQFDAKSHRNISEIYFSEIGVLSGGDETCLANFSRKTRREKRV